MAIIFFTGGLHNLGNNNLSGDNKRSFEKRIRDCLVVIKGEGKVGHVVLYYSRETPHCDCTILTQKSQLKHTWLPSNGPYLCGKVV